MNWSMPRPVLLVVAAVIGAASLGAFTLGIVTAPDRGRLPGERLEGQAGSAIEATEAQPLSAERIEGPPPPPELTEEEKAKLQAEAKAKEEAAAMAKAEAEKAAAPPPPPLVIPPDRIGEALEKAPPPPEEPVF